MFLLSLILDVRKFMKEGKGPAGWANRVASGFMSLSAFLFNHGGTETRWNIPQCSSVPAFRPRALGAIILRVLKKSKIPVIVIPFPCLRASVVNLLQLNFTAQANLCPRRKSSIGMRFFPSNCNSFTTSHPSLQPNLRKVLPSVLYCPGSTPGVPASLRLL